MITKQQSIVLVAACLTGLLAGCNNPTFDAELGSAVEQNKAAHIVNAQPAASEIDSGGPASRRAPRTRTNSARCLNRTHCSLSVSLFSGCPRNVFFASCPAASTRPASAGKDLGEEAALGVESTRSRLGPFSMPVQGLPHDQRQILSE